MRFEGIRKLQCTTRNANGGGGYIEGMVSSEQEVVKFCKEVNPFREKGAVEKWLAEVEKMMRMSLQLEVIEAVDRFGEMGRHEWIEGFPGQIVLVTSDIVLTSELSNV